MAFSEIELQRIKKTVGGLCTKKTPEHLSDQLRFDYDVEGQSVVILEIRPVWNNPGEYLRMPPNSPSPRFMTTHTENRTLGSRSGSRIFSVHLQWHTQEAPCF